MIMMMMVVVIHINEHLLCTLSREEPYTGTSQWQLSSCEPVWPSGKALGW